MWPSQGCAAGSSGACDDGASSSLTTYKKSRPRQPRSRQDREQHMERRELWLCKICNKECSSKAGLNCHITMVHEQPKQRPIKDIKVQECSSKSSLNRHFTVVQKQPKQKTIKDIKVQECSSQTSLNRHLTANEQPKPKLPLKIIKDSPRAAVAVPYPYRSNTERVVCNICGKDFVSQSNLTRHQNTVHVRNATITKNKVVQKNTTNVTINMYAPTFDGYSNQY